MFYKSIQLLFAGCLIFSLSGCEKEEGSAKNAGKSIDQAVENIEDTEAMNAILDGEVAENAGESLDDAADSVVDKYEEAMAAVEEKFKE